MLPFEIKTLNQFPERSEEVLEIIHQEFNYPQEHSFHDDFYCLFNKDNFKHCHVVLINDEIIGHIGIKLRQLGIKNIWTPVALIGGIAIKKKYQGQGLFKKVFQKILIQYASDVSLFILWSNLSNFYKKFHFYECGETIQTNNNSFNLNSFEKYKKVKLSELNFSQLDQIKKLYQKDFEQKNLGLKRNPQDWQEMQSVKSCDLYIKEINDCLSAYFFVGKGKDLSGIIHEASDTANIDLANFKMWLSSDHANRFPNSEVIFTAFIKWSNLEKLNEFFKKLTSHQLKIIKMDEKEITFTFNKNNFTTHPQEFAHLLFGPGAAKEFKSIIPPFFVTGHDSV